MRVGVRARLGRGGLKRAAREAAIAAGEAAVAGRGDAGGFSQREFEGLGALPGTSMLRRSSSLREMVGRPGWGEADRDTEVSEN